MAVTPPVGRVFRKGTNDPARGSGSGSMDELPTSYAPRYPFNHVLASTESGHSIEADDTPGAERITVYHRSGSHIEMYPDGSVKVKSTKTRQDVTIGDHEMIIQGDWKVTVDGATKLYVRNGSLEIQADQGAAINVSGELKLHADNILMKAKNKISLEAPFVDMGIGSPPFLSLPGGVGTLFGVPVPLLSGFKIDPSVLASLVAQLALMAAPPVIGVPNPGLVKMAQEIATFASYAQDATASADFIKTLPKDPTTGDPQVAEIDQPTEMPLASPLVYTGTTTDKVLFRDRQFDTPSDVEDTETYSAHLNLSDELQDFNGVGDAKDLPGQVYASDVTAPAAEPLPARVFIIDGVVTCTTGNTTIVGVGTTFTTDVEVGQSVLINDQTIQVASVPDDATIIATTPWVVSPVTGAAIYVYKLRPFKEFFQKYGYTDNTPLGESGLVVRDLMHNFLRPIAEKSVTSQLPNTPNTPSPDPIPMPGDPTPPSGVPAPLAV